jgi:hypothetical protein
MIRGFCVYPWMNLKAAHTSLTLIRSKHWARDKILSFLCVFHDADRTEFGQSKRKSNK